MGAPAAHGTAVVAYISDIPDVNPLTSTETVAQEIAEHVTKPDEEL